MRHSILTLPTTALRLVRRTAAALLTLTLCTVCQWMTEDYDDLSDLRQPAAPKQYINITIAVDGGSDRAATRTATAPGCTVTASRSTATTPGSLAAGVFTRASSEVGFGRENQVDGITLILYKDDVVDFVNYFPVTPEGRDTQGTTGTPYYYNTSSSATFQSEARYYYTTGDCEITDELDFSGTYHVLIVANKDLTSDFSIRTSISDILDYQIPDIVSNYDYKQPWNATGFVMTSVHDATIDFATIYPTEDEDKIVYNVSEPLRIERMAARIDFCTEGGTYEEDKEGYVYSVEGTTDIFVVKRITPFNLYNENEYLFKRVTTGLPSGTITYFGNETTTNYVVDPYTANKDNVNTYTYLSPLQEDFTTNALTYGIDLNDADVREWGTFEDANGYKNVIIAYAKENTLMLSSPLMKYATGIAIEGDYYVGGEGTPTPYIYYTYLRHQGSTEGSSDALQWSSLENDATCGDMAMKFGVVRNNIYCVRITGIAKQTP